jgi:hypothetical protein
MGEGMSAKNIYHDLVIQLLVTDGWTITDDPLKIEYGERKLYVDLGAERSAIGAERNGRKIAVEIQSFIGQSPVRDLQAAAGQYGMYAAILEQTDPERTLFMAIEQATYGDLFNEPLGQLMVQSFQIRLIVFDEPTKRIVQWTE